MAEQNLTLLQKTLPSTFMVAVDGSPSAHQAFHYALQHSARDDHIIVVTGIRKKYPNLTPEITSDASKMAIEKARIKEINNKQKQKGEELLKTYQDLCQKAERQCTFTKVKFRASGGSSVLAEELCKTAENAKVDGLIMGSRGLTPFKRMMVGSVSDYCVHNCHCTVTVVKNLP